MGLDGTVNLGGHPVPKKALALTAAAAGGFVLWRYMRGRSGTGAAGSESTGDPYGLAGASGQAESSGTAGGGGSGGGGGSASTPSTGGLESAITSNGQWTQSAVDYLSGLGYDSATVLGSLSRYLAGTYTDTDRAIITATLGTLGPPPAGNYTWPVVPPSTATTPTGATSPATPTTPTPSTPAPAPAPSAPATGTTGGGPTGTINRPPIGGAATKSLTLAATDNWNTIATKTGKTLDQLRAVNGGSLTSALLGKGKTVKY